MESPVADTSAARNVTPADDKATFAELAMISITALPVLGAMVSAPIVGSTLAGLAIFDSLKILITGN